MSFMDSLLLKLFQSIVWREAALNKNLHMTFKSDAEFPGSQISKIPRKIWISGKIIKEIRKI